MEHPIEITTPDRARAVIARHVLGTQGDDTVTLGDVHLYPHQIDALGRVRAALGEFGGALLCDEVGLGKTFVALATAKAYADVRVVAPAVLRAMWLAAAERAHVAITFTSIEALGRGNGCISVPPHLHTTTAQAPTPAPGPLLGTLVVVDEAHHARNPATKRYATLARLCANAHTLLLTATPVHNARADLDTLLALPLGARARALAPDAVGRIVIRRAKLGAAAPKPRPRVTATRWLIAPADDAVLDAILALPPPLPPRDGGDGGPLVVHTLARQWASSDAALLGALRRRIARATAMLAALDDGRHPSAGELRAWTYADDAVQLAFPALLVMPEPAQSTAALATAVRAHDTALRALVAHLRQQTGDTAHAPDTARAALLREVRRRHPGERIIAFSQYGDTASALYRTLRADGQVAALTHSGGIVAGGGLTRADVLARFAPLAHGISPRACDDVTLLLTTDLLSEGVNLQDASVVVHLDLPWTTARLRQRVGRVARLGSRHPRVAVYAFRPPARAERLLGITGILRAKAETTRTVVGRADARAHAIPRSASVPEHVEATRDAVATWQSDTGRGDTRHGDPRYARQPHSAPDASAKPDATPAARHVLTVAAVTAARRACLAACVVDGQPMLLATIDEDAPSRATHPAFTTDPATVHAVVRLASSTEPTTPSARAAHSYVSAIHTWHAHHCAAIASGAACVSPPSRATRARRSALRHVARLRATEPIARRVAAAMSLAATQRRLGEPLPAGAELALIAAARSHEVPDWHEMSRDRTSTPRRLSIRVVAILMTEPAP